MHCQDIHLAKNIRHYAGPFDIEVFDVEFDIQIGRVDVMVDAGYVVLNRPRQKR